MDFSLAYHFTPAVFHFSTGLWDKYACFTRLAATHKQHFVSKTLEHFLKTYSRVDCYLSSYRLSVSPSVKWNLFFMTVHGVTYQFSPFSDAVMLLSLQADSTSLSSSMKSFLLLQDGWDWILFRHRTAAATHGKLQQ